MTDLCSLPLPMKLPERARATLSADEQASAGQGALAGDRRILSGGAPHLGCTREEATRLVGWLHELYDEHKVAEAVVVWINL